MAAFVGSRIVLRTLLKPRSGVGGLIAPSFLRVSAPQEKHTYISRRVAMLRISVFALVLVVCFATALQAQAPAPKPGPEVKKLHVGIGHWTYEGTYKPGPLGSGGNFTGEFTGQMILGGFFYQGRWTEKGPGGEAHGIEIDGYEPVNKNITSTFYVDDGSRFSGTLTVTGNTWTYEGMFTVAGKPYQFKGTFVLAPDMVNATYNCEIAPEGQPLVPWFDSKYTKVKPAANK